ncbi:glutamate--cysteine ligase [Candidatus Neomarinimicrobiota bacterium]
MEPTEATQFNSSPAPTIGVEVELFIVDNDTKELVGGAPYLLDQFPDEIWVKPELLESIIEINTDICENTSQVRVDLARKIDAVANVAEEAGWSLLAMGTHPFASWTDAHVTNNRRYQDFLQRMQFPVRRLVICGLHVHIGIESGEKAIAVVNGLTRYVPHFIALAANSPFWMGEETGLASTRMKVFEGMPTGGLPARLRNYSEFQRLMRTLQRAQALESIRELWWDIRPHPGFGTVEMRLCDAVSSLDHIVAIAALTQCLVVALAGLYDEAEQLPLLSEWVVRENKWRAVRYGFETQVIVDDDGEQLGVRESLLQVIDKLQPISVELGCESDLQYLRDMLPKSPAYQRQRDEYHRTGDYNPVIATAIRELRDDARNSLKS